MGHEVERDGQAGPGARLKVVPGHQDHLLARGKPSGRSLVRVVVRGDDHVVAVGGVVEEALDPVQLLPRGGRVVPNDGRPVLTQHFPVVGQSVPPAIFEFTLQSYDLVRDLALSMN